jgi:glycosyltransferase involved in cell wall biosynthesis
MVSVIIPSRSPEYLQQTIDGILDSAEGEVEVIAALDGIWPDPIIKDNPKVALIHQGEVHNNLGMRAGINAGVDLARGEYIMKIDEHCALEKGFDTKLVRDCKDDWLIVPRRYRFDPEKWEVVKDGRDPVDYMFIAYPYERPFDKTCGLHGDWWREKYRERKDVMIDDLMTMQGSCWFMKKDYFNKLFPNGLDDINYGTFTQEAQELSNTVWLSGGRVVVDKNTWYAHFHKGKKGKGYGFSNEQYKRHMEGMERGRLYCIEYWLNTKDFKHDFEWLVQKFWPIPTWPDNWKEQIEIDKEKDYSRTKYKNDEWLAGLRT